MSNKIAHNRILKLLVIASIGAVIAACAPYKGDPGAKRTQQQSEELRDRVMTTQIDR